MHAWKRFGLVAALAALLVPGSASAKDIYVDNTFVGTSDGTITKPWKSIRGTNGGLSKVTAAGDRVIVRGSGGGGAQRYPETISNSDLPISGTLAAPCVLMGYTGEVVLISPALGSTSGARLTIGTTGSSGTKNFWTFDNLHFDQRDANGLVSGTDCIIIGPANTSSSLPVHHITIKNCDIGNGNREGISVRKARQVTIEDCYIHDFMWLNGEPGCTSARCDAHGIELTTDTAPVDTVIAEILIQRNTFTRLSGDGSQIFANTDDDTTRYARGVQYLNNTFIDGTSVGSNQTENAIDMKGGRDVVIRGNVMTGYTNNKTIVVQKGCQRVTVENNVISSGYQGVEMRVEATTPADFIQRNARVVGNIIHDMTGYGLKFDGVFNLSCWNNTIVNVTRGFEFDNTEADSEAVQWGVFRNNLVYKTSGTISAPSDTTYLNNCTFGYNGWFPSTTGMRRSTDISGAAGAAVFISTATYDYRLTPASPAVDAGGTADLDSCMGHPDIGALERCDATYFVNNVIGLDSNAGTTPAAPWRTIGKANTEVPQANTTNGNVTVNIAASGSAYTEAPNPVNVARNGKRFYYVGNIANPAATFISFQNTPEFVLTDSSLSIVGLDFRAKLVLSPTALYDSVRYCKMEALEHNGSYSVVANSTIQSGLSGDGNVKVHSPLGGYDVPGTIVHAPEIQNCEMPSMNENGLLVGGYTTGTPNVPNRVDSLLFLGNHMSVSQTGVGTVPTGGWYMQNPKFVANRTRLTSTVPSPQIPGVGAWTVRDSSFNIQFRRDTVLSVGTAIVAPWSFGAKASSQRLVDSCYWQASNGLLVRDQMLNDSIFRSVIVSNLAAVTVEAQVRDYNWIDHNTLIGDAATMPRGVINFAIATWDTSANQNDLTFTNNILYAGGFEPTPGIACGSSAQRAAYWGNARASIAYALTSDYNLYSFYGRLTTAGDKSIGWKDSCSTVGDNNLWSTALQQEKVVSFEADSNSVYGSPQFLGDSTHTTAWATQPWTLGNSSRAKATGSSSSDIGAIDYVSSSALVLNGEQIKGGQELTFLFLNNTDVSQTIPLNITNTGVADLTVDVETYWTSDPHGLQPSPGSQCSEISFDTNSLTVAGGETGTINITFTSGGPVYLSGVQQPHEVICYVRLVTNAPEQPVVYLFIDGHNLIH